MIAPQMHLSYSGLKSEPFNFISFNFNLICLHFEIHVDATYAN